MSKINTGHNGISIDETVKSCWTKIKGHITKALNQSIQERMLHDCFIVALHVPTHKKIERNT